MFSVQQLLTVRFADDLRSSGLLIMDVDDTILSRRNGSTVNGETFAESEAAQLIPKLLERGCRVALITGHGWEQLNQRLVKPLAAATGKTSLERLQIYANRGASQILRVRAGFALSPDENSTLVSTELTELMPAIFAVVHERVNGAEATIRDNIVLSFRPITNDREGVIAAMGRCLIRLGVADKYEVSAAGKSTVELMPKGFSKSNACADVFEEISKQLAGSTPADVRRASLYIGDEFGLGGNDRDVASAFADLNCVSVLPFRVIDSLKNVILADGLQRSDPSKSTAQILSRLIKLLDSIGQSDNL